MQTTPTKKTRELSREEAMIVEHEESYGSLEYDSYNCQYDKPKKRWSEDDEH